MARDFEIKIAGIPMGIHCLQDDVYRLCRAYWWEGETAFSVSVSQEDIEAERRQSEQENAKGYSHSDGYLETLAVYRKIVTRMPTLDGFLMHGSVLAKDDRAHIFIAKSGTGKTTHTRLWLKNVPGCYVVNGDKPIIRFVEGIPYACGTPWSGKERMNTNAMVSLKSVVLLERAKENSMWEISAPEAFPAVLQQTYRPPEKEAMTKTLFLLQQLSEKVKFYRLGCNMSDEAALTAARALGAI